MSTKTLTNQVDKVFEQVADVIRQEAANFDRLQDQ
jgi:hypothetical protein